MNRRKVITENITFKEFRRIKAGLPPPSAQKVIEKIEERPEELTLQEIIKFSKDKKNVRSDRKRKRLTLDMFIEYIDINYNNDEF